MQYAGAFNPLYILRRNVETSIYNLHHYKADRMPISVYINEKPFSNNYIELKKDDNIYLFSDGFADQSGGKNKKKFLSRRFKQLLLDNCSKPMYRQKKILYDTFYKWKGDEDQIDDILIVGFQIP